MNIFPCCGWCSNPINMHEMSSPWQWTDSWWYLFSGRTWACQSCVFMETTHPGKTCLRDHRLSFDFAIRMGVWYQRVDSFKSISSDTLSSNITLSSVNKRYIRDQCLFIELIVLTAGQQRPCHCLTCHSGLIWLNILCFIIVKCLFPEEGPQVPVGPKT